MCLYTHNQYTVYMYIMYCILFMFTLLFVFMLLLELLPPVSHCSYAEQSPAQTRAVRSPGDSCRGRPEVRVQTEGPF